ncbi:NAD(P)/FAD-dependent oxidoreductase, partial [Candidatus Bathyarchaeota archaeon]|nr:NAD(P)/FAD-dependent oxidoreductase [Candidatus Bathyarchaeota archaeon]
MRAEAVVVGAGPAGLIAAREIASRGYDVKVFEEHPEVGVPNHCAGLVSVDGLRRLGVEPSADFVQHEIVGGKVYSPSGVSVEVRGGRTRAYAVDRSALDAYLANKAEESGADVITDARAEGLLT